VPSCPTGDERIAYCQIIFPGHSVERLRGGNSVVKGEHRQTELSRYQGFINMRLENLKYGMLRYFEDVSRCALANNLIDTCPLSLLTRNRAGTTGSRSRANNAVSISSKV
jgi:hypothetical protein